jgi:hypothetical protein
VLHPHNLLQEVRQCELFTGEEEKSASSLFIT